MSKRAVSPFTSIPSEPISGVGKYPYLVVRIMAAVYQHERIAVREGEPSVAISPQKTYVQYPEPITDDGRLSDDCRTLLLNAVKEAVMRTKFRMSVVWGEGDASYVEPDGSIQQSSSTPSGGVQLPNKIAFDQRVVVDSPEDQNH